MKILLKILFTLILCFLLLEIIARFCLGFGNPPLYISDPDFEYIFAPNQHATRFGNNIITNAYGMRSDELSPKEKIRILEIGDSILNGGIQTDQDSLSSSLLEKRLQKAFQDKIRVLNLSAGSWGPDNGMAYIKKRGNFNASLFVLIFSSHDYYDNMGAFKNPVGIDPSYPSSKPGLATIDMLQYLINNVKTRFFHESDINIEKIQVNQGWQAFLDYTKSNNIALLVYLHPDMYEIEHKEYNSLGQNLISFFQKHQIKYVLPLGKMNRDYYKDDIHLNEKGQRAMANILYPYLEKFVSEHLKSHE